MLHLVGDLFELKRFTYSECLSQALVILHAVRMRPVVYSSLSLFLYHVFPHCLTNGTI